jgi:hypothetical protein
MMMDDTVASLCDLSAPLQALPAQPLRELLARASGREFLKGTGPTDMLKVFISEHLCDDVEDIFGPYSDRHLSTMAGKDFMLTLSFDRRRGIDSLEVGQFIGSRLVHWNRHYERLLLEKARQHGIQEIVSVLEGSLAVIAGPASAKSRAKVKRWWQLWK